MNSGTINERVFYASFDSRLIEVTPINVGDAIDVVKSKFATNEIDGALIKGFSGVGLEFLREISNVKRLLVWSDAELQEIERLTELKSLGLSETRSSLDLRNLKSLTELAYTWSPRIHGLSSLPHLKALTISKVRTQDKTLRGVLPSTLHEVLILQSPLESLSGLEDLTLLEKCELSYLPKLQDISALAALKDSLKFLDIQNAKRITNHHTLGALENLDELRIWQCKSMPSIGWLRSLKRLRRFVFMDTRIEDGDLSPLLDLPNLEDAPGGYLKHYRPSMKEVEATLKQRQMQKR